MKLMGEAWVPCGAVLDTVELLNDLICSSAA